MLENIKRIFRYYFRNPPKFVQNRKNATERHGTVYGGWNIIPNSLNQKSIVYSIGIGEDISFDLSIIKKYSCNIFAYDPTPKVKEWLKKQDYPKQFIFQPIALSSYDGILTFYSPENENHISHKLIPSENSKAVNVPCNKLKSLIDKNNHNHIDLLKMDIEGFEYSVIDELLLSNVLPKQLLIEFHHFFPEIGNKKTEDAIKKLQDNGYELFAVADSFCEYSFIYTKS